MKALFTFFLLFTITLISAQEVVQDSISIQETKRPERTKTITVGPFTGIKLFSGIQVKLIPSNENKLVLDRNLWVKKIFEYYFRNFKD